MLKAEEVLSFAFFQYGGVFSGSFDMLSVRYRIVREGEKPDFLLRASIWPGPNAFDKTEPEKIVTETFPYSEEGRMLAISWLNAEHEKMTLR